MDFSSLITTTTSTSTTTSNSGKKHWFQLMVMKGKRPLIVKTFQLSSEEIAEMGYTLAELQELELFVVKSGDVKPGKE